MKFFAVNGERPVRLSESTRKFAFESINYKYGLDTLGTPFISLSHIDGFENMTPAEKYNCAITEIVTKAPLRICENELISGAATLGDAISHQIPVRYNGTNCIPGISHLTLDFETVLRKGTNYIEETAKSAYSKYKGTEKEAFAHSCLHVIDCMKIWHKRYLDQLSEMPEYLSNYHNLLNVPFNPPKSFYEAVQSLWFTFVFTRLCGTWPGIGRIDWLLGEYLEKDLTEGIITIDEAREILAHFFIKGCEWITGKSSGSGDAQHYQNILLAGIDENGREVTNTVTYLVLDILEETGISDFPTTVRINKNTDEKLLKRLSEVIRLGGGVIAIYNEDLIIDSLVKYGYDPSEARKFANDGCWEIQIPGKTFFSYIPFDSLQILQKKTLANYTNDVSYTDFEALYRAFIKDLEEEVWRIAPIPKIPGTIENTDHHPHSVVSIFEKGCIEKGLSYFELGPEYNVISPHIGGLPDVVNSLYAIKKLVFDNRLVSFSELMDILKNDWQDNDSLRAYALNKLTYFGNDNDEVDEIAKNILEDFANMCDSVGSKCLHKTPAGVSTFGRQLQWSPHRIATPYGKRAGDVLAGNFSPTPGTDKEGATAIIKSYCKADLTRTVSGAALDIKLLPAAVKGDAGLASITSLIKGFVSLGGHFMQLDIADTELLKLAQIHPEDYQNLSVRISGWNARFVTLNKEWQDMIITQTGSDF